MGLFAIAQTFLHIDHKKIRVFTHYWKLRLNSIVFSVGSKREHHNLYLLLLYIYPIINVIMCLAYPNCCGLFTAWRGMKANTLQLFFFSDHSRRRLRLIMQKKSSFLMIFGTKLTLNMMALFLGLRSPSECTSALIYGCN